MKDDDGRRSVGCVGEKRFGHSDSEMGVSGGIGANDSQTREMRQTDRRVVESLKRSGEGKGGGGGGRERGCGEYED
jgi:hypothetical protein